MHKAYVAGLFDGEGHIGVGSPRSNPHGQVRVSISNSCLPVLTRLKTQYKGSIYEISGSLRKRRIYQWQISNKRGQIRFLKDIHPHLIIKQLQVEHALEWLKLIGPPGKHVAPETLNKRQVLTEAIKILNANPLGVELLEREGGIDG